MKRMIILIFLIIWYSIGMLMFFSEIDRIDPIYQFLNTLPPFIVDVLAIITVPVCALSISWGIMGIDLIYLYLVQITQFLLLLLIWYKYAGKPVYKK
ncbi:MAG: hypothetical protein QM660_07460 [Dysgonomonas sp.]